MRLIFNNRTDPAWNIAADEYYLTSGQDVVALWRNAPSVIIGKNQNALEEIDLDFVNAHQIPVVRRLSGGGAVFHDLGNVNFTFTCPYSEAAFADYARFAAPVCDYLRTLGVEAGLSGRNDILVGDRKISGNAQAVRKGRLMSHGTLLYSADLSRLSGALRVSPGKLASKGVKSVRSRVANLADLLENPPPVEDFLRGLQDFLARTLHAPVEPLTDAECAAISALADARYRSWAWNFGESPKYNFAQDARFPAGGVSVRLIVADGSIREARVFGDFFGREDVSLLEQALTGVEHRPDAVRAVLDALPSSRCVEGVPPEDLTRAFF